MALELCKVVYPKRALRIGRKLYPASLGALLGLHYALAAYLCGEVIIEPQVPPELTPLPKLTKALDAASTTPPTKPWEIADPPGLRRVLVQAFAAALEQPYPEALAFVEAFARAARIQPGAWATDHLITRSTRLYFVLLMLWRVVERFPSLGALHRMLCQAVGKEKVGEFKSFEKLCQKVGLRLRGPGRPIKGG